MSFCFFAADGGGRGVANLQLRMLIRSRCVVVLAWRLAALVVLAWRLAALPRRQVALRYRSCSVRSAARRLSMFDGLPHSLCGPPLLYCLLAVRFAAVVVLAPLAACRRGLRQAALF
jgi:hypothetical protein